MMAEDGSGGTDPQKLEGKSEDSTKPREFFWDSISLYVVGVIIALAAIDAITEFLRGSSVVCFSPSGKDITEAQENFINNICALSLPVTEYFPVFIVVHGILISIPHYLWLNHYGGNFEFFFCQARQMDRTRTEQSGEYPGKNRIIVQQLTLAFTTYKQNWMFILYVVKLAVQTGITVAGFLAAILFFDNFNEIFLCPRSFNTSDTFWPFDTPVNCVFTSLRLFAAIRMADLILLVLLILCFIWSLIWCASTHSTELGTDNVALFCFHTGMSPEHHVPKLPFGWCCRPAKRFLRRFFKSIPWFGRDPRIRTNLDFLVLKLFRTDSGLGFVFREVQILEKIKHHNDDDQRRTNLHKRQQQTKTMKDGDLIHPQMVKGFDGDLKWHFTKLAGVKGIFDTNIEAFDPNTTLIIPDTFRGAIVGFSSLAPSHKRALYITFGSVSFGIPSALSRVFTKVGVLNFNPYFKPPDEDGVPFISKTYASDIVNVVYPEDILASEIEKSSDFAKGLEDIWGANNATADLIVIGPLHEELHMSTLSLFISKIAKIPQPPKSRFTQGCVLLTMHPREVAGKRSEKEFYTYTPPKRYFESYPVMVKLDKEAVSIPWPPSCPATVPRQVQSGSSIDLRVACGDSHSTFCFSLYKYPINNSQNQTKQRESQPCIIDDIAQEHSTVDVREPTP